MKRLTWLLLVVCALPLRAEQPLAEQVESLKEQVVQLNRDLFILEEDLLFPASTQVAVFVSLDVGEFFTLDGVELTIDGERIAASLYTERQVDALRRGAIQRLYIGNLKNGGHEITALITGTGPQQRDYRRGATITIDKGSDAKMVELQIVDDSASQQPQFRFVEWQ